MPVNVVKTKSEEKLWERAKEAADKSDLKGDAYWALTNSIFQKMKKAHSATEPSMTTANDLEVLARNIELAAVQARWTAAIAALDVTAANPSKTDILNGLNEIKKAFSRFGEIHWNDAQQLLGNRAQRLIEAVEAVNEVIKFMGGSAKAPPSSTQPKKDFGVPKEDVEFAPQASVIAGSGSCPECGGKSVQPAGKGTMECLDCRHDWPERPQDKSRDTEESMRMRNRGKDKSKF